MIKHHSPDIMHVEGKGAGAAKPGDMHAARTVNHGSGVIDTGLQFRCLQVGGQRTLRCCLCGGSICQQPVTHRCLKVGIAFISPFAGKPDKFWHDNKGARLNAIRTRKGIADADIVVVRFGEKYKQWNAAFDAGYAAALGKSLIIMHGADHQHALKEVDAAALAVVEEPAQVVSILRYVLAGTLVK